MVPVRTKSQARRSIKKLRANRVPPAAAKAAAGWHLGGEGLSVADCAVAMPWAARQGQGGKVLDWVHRVCLHKFFDSLAVVSIALPAIWGCAQCVDVRAPIFNLFRFCSFSIIVTLSPVSPASRKVS
jgi:hypothetical protein